MNPNNTHLKDIQRLIRLKRYERPPEGYYQNVLTEFQEARKARRAKRSFWGSFIEQLEAHLPKIHIPASAYATIGLFAIVASAWILTNTEFDQPSSIVAEDGSNMSINLNSPAPEAFPRPVEIPSKRFVGTLPTHYVLQSRPSEHDEPFSF